MKSIAAAAVPAEAALFVELSWVVLAFGGL